MPTECSQESFEFLPRARRQVQERFDGVKITSDAGDMLLYEVKKCAGIIAQFVACFRDHRDLARIEHPGGEFLCWARLRSSNIGPAEGGKEELEQLIP